MEILNPEQEARIAHFADQLSQVNTVEDLFPPEDGVVARLPEVEPRTPFCERLCLAAVYDIASVRRRREALLQKSGQLALRIDQLVGA
jgi:hypothetical protein